ncbi:MAG: hypothetical protein WA840_00650, partial [Caulobacteraceae bacterium]
MILLVLGVVLLVVVFGGRRLGAGLRGVVDVWRPTAGLASVAALIGALALVLREDWLPAAGLGLVSMALAFSARRRRRLDAAKANEPPPQRMSPDEARAILG